MHRFGVGQSVNSRILGRQIRSACRVAYPSVARFAHWVYQPVQYWVTESIPESRVIYECYDEYTLDADGRVRDKLWKEEIGLMGRADVTFVTSHALELRRRGFSSDLRILPNGVADEFFVRNVDATSLIDSIPHPRLICLGNIHAGWNYPLLEAVAGNHPSWQFIFIGPKDRSLKARVLAPLKRLPNTHFLGYQPYEQLPSLLIPADLGLAVLRRSATAPMLTHLKLMEYMACGLPVVSTLDPGDDRVREYIRVTEPAANPLTAAIEQALEARSNEDRERRIQFAREFSWARITERVVIPALAERVWP